jgi:hypothetical protein
MLAAYHVEPVSNVTKRGASRLTSGILITLAIGCSLYVAATIIHAPPARLVQYVPDDSFYYLTLARNFATQGRWTFDSGVSVTSGFHLLHAYVLAGAYALLPVSPESFVRLSVTYSYLLLLAVFTGAAVFVWRTRLVYPALIFFLIVISRNVLINEISATEWTWVVSGSALMFAAFSGLDGQRPKRAALLLTGACLAGSLARSDFGWQPAALLMAALVMPGPTIRLRRGRITGALSGLGASTIGTMVVLVHSRVVTGGFLQSSARMKLLWLDGHPSAVLIVAKCLSLIGPVRGPWLGVSIAFAGVGAWLLLRFLKQRVHDEPCEAGSGCNVTRSRDRILCFASLLICGGYVLFYAFDAAVQSWYTANMIVPIFVMMCLPALHASRRRALVVLATGLAMALTVPQAWAAAAVLRVPAYPNQAAMYRAGLYLQRTHLDHRIASWNAGVIGFYQGGSVINLDGLVNNDIYGYAKAQRLEDYIDRTAIGYIIDSDLCLKDPNLRRRGGYDSAAFLNRFQPLVVFSQAAEEPGVWGSVTLYKLAPGSPPRF